MPTVIDQGVVASQPFDQRGFDRTVDYSIANPTGGDGTDVGAVEVQGAQPTGTTPQSPGDSASTKIYGITEPAATVSLFAGNSCATLANSGPGTEFAPPGITLAGPFAQNTANVFTASAMYGTATSECSTPITYARRPAVPTVTATDPPSGANNNAPKVIGTATASSTVNIYRDPSCAGPIAGSGTGTDFASTGIPAAVPDNSTTIFYAQSTGVGGTSQCSATVVSYTEVTPAPPAPPVTTSTPPTTAKKKCKKGFKLKKVKGKKKCVKKK